MNRETESLVLNVRGGARFCVPATLDQITPYVLLEQEDWFEDEIRFVRRWLRPGMRAIDVGASFGVYAVAMARAVGRNGRVWAFEPTPAVARYLRRNLDLNGCDQATVIVSAVSDRGGSVTFAVGERSELNSVAGANSAYRDFVEVSAVTLDQMAGQQDWRDVDFVKLDVEGHEFEAIRGGAGFFAATSPLVMLEIRTRRGIDLRALGQLAEWGYEFFRLLPGPLLLTPFDLAESMDPFLINLFACKGDRVRKLGADRYLAESDATALGSLPNDAWAAYARSAPYAMDLSLRWPSKPRFFASADRVAYFEGLAAYAHARNAGLGAEERLGWLECAYRCIAEALDVSDTLPRRISFARLAWELGWRNAAVTALKRAADEVMTGATRALEEPLLAPSPRYEQLRVGDGAATWLQCAVIEQYEKLCSFTSMFQGAESIAALEPISGLPHRSAEVDRRGQLVRMRLGMQEVPVHVPDLCLRTEENLNPQFWSGAGRTVLSVSGRH